MTGPGSSPLQRAHQEGLGGGGLCVRSVQALPFPRGAHEINPTSLTTAQICPALCPFAAAILALFMLHDAAKLVHAFGTWQSFYPQPGTTLSHPWHLPSHHPALSSSSVFSICDDLVHVFICLSVT